MKKFTFNPFTSEFDVICIGGGLVYINNITPTGGGNVGDKVYVTGSNDSILESCSTDDSGIRVYVIAMVGSSNLRPSVTVNGTAVGNWDYDAYATDNRVLFKGYADITLSGTTVTAIHEDGASATCTVSADANPVISTAQFVNGYPGSQTEVKSGDTYDIQVVADLAFVNIQVEASGACSGQTTAVASGTDRTISATIADQGDTAVLRAARVRVQKASGTWSAWVYTNVGGSVDGTNVVNCNNLYPSIETMNQGSITYPVSQEAIKDSETVTVHSTCSDYDTITYSSPNGDLSIPSTSTYLEDKTSITRIAGNYNISTANYQISCNRAANDSTTTKTLVVYIAHTALTVTMSEASRLRTGGNDGTSAQNHTITMTCSQQTLSTPTIAAASAGGGTWSGVFAGGPTEYTRTLIVDEASDTVGTYNYNALSAINLAGIETTSYTGDSQYIIGGFVSRDITLSAFANEASFGAAVVTYTKCSLTWTFKSLPTRDSYNSSTAPQAGAWCFVGTLNTSPTTARILDTAATAASSDDTTLTIEESI